MFWSSEQDYTYDKYVIYQALNSGIFNNVSFGSVAAPHAGLFAPLVRTAAKDQTNTLDMPQMSDRFIVEAVVRSKIDSCSKVP